ncbi:MAG: hypothetical protein KDD15_00695 [Lewinella sp.]|nr:hypothetical protein [Lewinella sp.]
MLNLIRKLDNYFKSTEIWSKTSHYHLWLLTGPESESDSPLGFITDGKRFILETDYNPQHYGFENTLQFDTEEMFFRALLEEMKKYSPWRECEELYDR